MRTESVAMELRCISNLTMRYIDRHSHKHYIDTITGTNGWVMIYLSEHEDEDIFQRDLEKRFDITRSTTSKVINLMVSKGLLEFERVPYDARLKKLILTDKARELVNLMKEDCKMLEEIIISGISDEDLELFLRCAEKIKNNLKENL